jgi:hypothetical protein
MSRTLNVVAADDERSLRDYFQELLPRMGHRVAVAAGGRQLVELCRAVAPDLVITDIRLEGAGGKPGGRRQEAVGSQTPPCPCRCPCPCPMKALGQGQGELVDCLLLTAPCLLPTGRRRVTSSPSSAGRSKGRGCAPGRRR